MFLKRGGLRLGLALVRTAVREPVRFVRAARLALRMAKGSFVHWAIHAIYFAEACVLRRWVAESRASHLHAHFATNPAEVAMLVRELGGPPYSFTAHGSDIMDRPAQMGLADKVSRAAFVVGVCQFGRSQMLRWLPHTLWRRIRVVGCGLERSYGLRRQRSERGRLAPAVCRASWHQRRGNSCSSKLLLA